MDIDTLYEGDCLDVLRTFPENSIDALVVDPPAGIHFMGVAFDSNRGGRKQWIAWMRDRMEECLRVLKPGAHGLVWALPRTSHWTATALEDAGFEIRTICHTAFGTGWPKGQDISKAIDKQVGAKRSVIGVGTSGKTRGVYNAASHPESFGGEYKFTAPSSLEAQRYRGWNTQLKPSIEHWILVRKPLSEKTIVKQVLTTGTGALNVGACAIAVPSWDKDTVRPKGQSVNAYEYSRSPEKLLGQATGGSLSGGRYPSDLTFVHSYGCTEETCVDGCPVAVLDEENGVRTSGTDCYIRKEPEEYMRNAYAQRNRQLGKQQTTYGDTGGVSRYFARFFYDDEYLLHYFTKASTSERNKFVREELAKNDHPTLKSLSLMQYLVRLVCPPEGIVLDCFAGTGTTCEAAHAQGFGFIGIEQDPHFAEIARHRIAHFQKEKSA